jgi:hypothetical protein
MERNPTPPAADTFDGEAMRTQPGTGSGNIFRTRTKLTAELFRSQPAMETRRRRVLLLFQEAFQRRALFGSPLQVQRHTDLRV